jgi:hypothetical protein
MEKEGLSQTDTFGAKRKAAMHRRPAIRNARATVRCPGSAVGELRLTADAGVRIAAEIHRISWLSVYLFAHRTLNSAQFFQLVAYLDLWVPIPEKRRS